jgi:hypothetical protein
MHKVVFYPVGNGDTSQIILANGRRLLFDFCHRAKFEEAGTPEMDLRHHLQDELRAAKRSAIDVLALTHGDSDHICGSTEFFELRHAAKYQGGDRIQIEQLWVPAAMILEEGTRDGQSEEVIIWRQEARHRLREGRGIRVFSRPDKLKDWLSTNGLSVESRRDLIIDAGQVVPGFSLGADGVEFFCHSPFIKHVDEGDDLRNPCSLIFNVRFQAGPNTFDYLAVGDSEWGVLEDIVATTIAHGRLDRLQWDLFNDPHHTSYLALSDEKGVMETKPKPGVEKLLRAGRPGAYIVSSSQPIPDTAEARAQTMPPHIQARRCYERYLAEIDGARFLVTMEEPSTRRPEPLVFNIAGDGITLDRAARSGPSILVSSPAPRAG